MITMAIALCGPTQQRRRRRMLIASSTGWAAALLLVVACAHDEPDVPLHRPATRPASW